ncbi:hypothetical protein [Nocardia salmonicida]|uniref:hypothetical protein n=1 Tax=Nocardia salmonicida TaxID=53431 RepID=UPI002E2A9189|nr:hypothetical protein [Nocardia salmonicida]
MANETPESPLSEQADQIWARTKEIQAKANAAWQPVRSIEGLALQTIGCWQLVVSEVNFVAFHAAGSEGPFEPERKLPSTIRGIADRYRIRWPHDEWSSAADEVGKIRHKIAHFLYVDSIVGERPHRTLKFVRLGEPGAKRIIDGQPAELDWRDETWSTQTRHVDTLTEDALRNAIYGMRWMWDCCRALNRLNYIMNTLEPPLNESATIQEHELDILPWWFDDWGKREGARLQFGALRP